MEPTSVIVATDPRPVLRQVQRVRSRLRACLKVELAAMAVVALAATWWALLALDYAFELPWGLRLAILLATGTWIIAWLYWSRGQSLWRPMPDDQVALWIARQRPQLADPLITSVEMKLATSGPMWDATRQWADGLAAELRPETLVSMRRPRRWVVAAIMLAASVAIFFVSQPAIAAHFTHRLALSDKPWPRRVRLIAEGFTPQADGSMVLKAARGAPLEVVLRAEHRTDADRPSEVVLDWRGARDARGRAVMVERTNGATEGSLFVHRFESAAEDFRLWARGGDGRLGPLRVVTVARPVLTKLEAHVAYPAYLEQASTTLPADSLERAPVGAQITLQGMSSKRLAKVILEPPAGDVRIDGQRIEIALPAISEPCSVALTLLDEDNIASEPPFTFSLLPIPDAAPTITLRATALSGVVTPQAAIVLEIDAADDYGLKRVTLEAAVDGETKMRRRLTGPVQETSQAFRPQIDLLSQRTAGPGSLGELKPGEVLRIAATAVDGYDLGEVPNSTSSRAIELEVVSQQQLLARVAEREANLRRVFEQTYATARKERLRLAESDGESWGEDPIPKTLRLAEAWRRIGDETAGAASTAAGIVNELTANRIDDTALIRRLQETVASPLQRLADVSIRELESRIESRTLPAECDAIALGLLDQMKGVIDQMRTVDEYNALVLSLRGLIDGQRNLEMRTEKAGKSSARSLLLD